MRARRYRAVVAAGLGLFSLLVAAVPASAAAPVTTLVVRRVDTTAMPKVTVDVVAGAHALSTGNVTLIENGKRLEPSAVRSYSDLQVPTATVLVLDTAATMNGAKMFAARDALKRIIAAKGPADTMALVAYGPTARTVQGFTADGAALQAAVDRVAVGGAADLYDGVRLGASLLSHQLSSLPQLVLVADSDDKGSTSPASAAAADILSSNALTYTIGLQFISGTDLSQPAQFAALNGGAMFTATNPGTTTDAVRQVIDHLHGQYRITYQSSGTHAASLVITAPGLQGNAQIVPGGIAVGSAVNPASVQLRQAPGLLRGKAGLLLVAVLVLAAAALLTYAAVLLITREGTALDAAMKPFGDHHADNEDGDGGGLLQSGFMKRAVATTGRIANDRGLLDIIEAKLEQADLALRPAEALFIYLIAAVLVTALALLEGGVMLALIALVIIAITPPAVLNFLAARRIRKFTSQLPDTLQLLASSLRAGFSFLQGVEAVAEEVSDPMG